VYRELLRGADKEEFTDDTLERLLGSNGQTLTSVNEIISDRTISCDYDSEEHLFSTIATASFVCKIVFANAVAVKLCLRRTAARGESRIRIVNTMIATLEFLMGRITSSVNKQE
jgi:hypothetical protein